jgi:hypothetical protein
MAPNYKFAGISGIYHTGPVYNVGGGVGDFVTAAETHHFSPSLVWAHTVLYQVRQVNAEGAKSWRAFANIYSYATSDGSGPSLSGSPGGLTINNCTNVTFSLDVSNCDARMFGVIYFIKTLPVLGGSESTSSSGISPAGSSAGSQVPPGPAGAQAGDGMQSFVVLYDPSSGQIVHTYKCVSLGGVKHRTKRQIETDARETMLRMAAGRSLPKRVSLLHVDPQAIDLDREYRVDPKRRVLVKVPVRKPREAKPAPRRKAPARR